MPGFPRHKKVGPARDLVDRRVPRMFPAVRHDAGPIERITVPLRDTVVFAYATRVRVPARIVARLLRVRHRLAELSQSLLTMLLGRLVL